MAKKAAARETTRRDAEEKLFGALIDTSTGQVALVGDRSDTFQHLAYSLLAPHATEGAFATADKPGTRHIKTVPSPFYTAGGRTTGYQRLTGTVLPSLRQRLLPSPQDLGAIIDSAEFYRKHHPWINRGLILRAGINATQFRINAPGNSAQDVWMLEMKRKLRMFSFMREFFWQMRMFGQVVPLWRTERDGRDPKSIECASLKVYQPRFNALDGSRPRIVVLPSKDENLRRLVGEARGSDQAKKVAALDQLKTYPAPLVEAAMSRSGILPAEVPAESLEKWGFHFEYTAYDKRHYEDWAFPGIYSIFPYLEMLMLADDADINALHHYKAGILLVNLGPTEPSTQNIELVPGDSELAALEKRLQDMAKARLPHWAARGDLRISWVVPPDHIMNPSKVASAKEKVLDWLGLPRLAFPGQDVQGAYASWQAALKILQQESEDERQLAGEFAEEWFFHRSHETNAFKGANWPAAWFDPNALNEPRIILELARMYKTLGGADEMTVAEMFNYNAEVFLARRAELKNLLKRYNVNFDPAFVPQKGAAPARPRGRPATTDQPTPEDDGSRQPRPSTSEAAEIVHRKFGISADEVRQALEDEYVGD